MKIRNLAALILKTIFLVTIFSGLPFLSVHLNNLLGFPTFTNFYFQIIGILIIFIGLIIVIRSAALHLQTGRKNWLPMIEPPKKFIATGLYRYCRNPMYLTETLMLIGLYLIFGYPLLLVYSLAFFLTVHLLVIYLEEPQLHKILGKTYTEYTYTVPRWLPKFPKTSTK